MNTCTIVGTVLKAKSDTTKTGKRVGKVRVETRRAFGDKVFTTRFDVMVYGQDAETAAALHEGTLVWANGEVSAYTNEYNGKTYANLQLAGRIGTIQGGDFSKHKEEFNKRDATPRQTAPTQQSLPSTSNDGPPPEEDDVPF